MRIPESQTALAKELGLNRKTITRWKDLPGWWETVNELARELFIRDTAQYYAALNREARKGHYQHLQLALEMSGELEQQTSDGTLRIIIDYEGNRDHVAPAAYGSSNGHNRSIKA